MSTGRAPQEFPLSITAPAANASATQSMIVGEAPDQGVLTEVSVLPAATSAANGSNYRTFTLFNRGSAGTGTVSMATMDTSSVALTDNDERLMTLSSTSANLVVAADDVLELVETVTGTGVAHSGYKAIAKISRT